MALEKLTPAKTEILVKAAEDWEITPEEAKKIKALIDRLDPKELDKLDKTLRDNIVAIIKDSLEDRETLLFQKYAQEIIKSDIETKGKVEVFKFQTYYNKIKGSGSTISVDWVFGNETLEAINSNIRLTQIFFVELGAKNIDGTELKVDGKWWDNSQAAMTEYFGEAKVSAEDILPALSKKTPKLASGPLAHEDSLRKISVSPEQAISYARKHIGIPENITGEAFKKKIAKFQKEHNLRPDGIIGRNVYVEMFTWNTYFKDGKVNILDESGKDIDLKVLADLKKVLIDGDYSSTNSIKIRSALKLFYETRWKDPDFDKKYRDFFNWFNHEEATFKESPKGKEIEKVVKSKSRDIYSIIQDPNKSWAEKIKEIATDPTTIMFGALLFLFGVVWGDTKYTDSFMKRLWWVLWGALFGKSIINKLWIDKAANDAMNYMSSEEAQKSFDTGREGVKKLWEDGVTAIKKAGWDVAWFDTSAVGTKYNSLLDSFKHRRNTLMDKVTKKPLISDETFTGLYSSVFSDKTFFNLSKDDLAKIQTKDQLFNVIWTDAENILNKLKLSDTDVANFVNKYLIPEMKGHDFVKDLFFSSQIADKLNDAILSVGATYISGNPELNTIVQTDLSNLAHTDSKSQKSAVDALSVAVITANASGSKSINFDLSKFPSLTNDEKNKIEVVLKRITWILTLQNDIQLISNRISSVKIATSWAHISTVETLEKDFTNIRKIKSEGKDLLTSFSNGKVHTVNIGNFNWASIDEAYEAKSLEIFKRADDLGAKKIGGIDVKAKLKRIEENKGALEKNKNISDRINSIWELPSTSASPLEMKAWYDANIESIEIIKRERWSITNSDLIKKVDALIWTSTTPGKYQKFIERYSSSAKKVWEEIKSLIAKIDGIPEDSMSITSYAQARNILEEVTRNYDSTLAKVLPTWTKKSGDDILIFFKNLINNKPTDFNALSETADSIRYLDKKLSLDSKVDIYSVKDAITTKITSLESGINIDLDLNSYDISTASDIRKIKEKVTQSSAIIDVFLSNKLREDNLEKLQKQVSQIETIFISKIEAETDPKKLNILYALYENDFRNFLKSNGEIVWEWFQRYFKSQDKVKEAYEKKLEDLEWIKIEKKREKILKMQAWDTKVLWVVSIITSFLETHKSNNNISKISTDLWSLPAGTTIGDVIEIIKLRDSDDTVKKLLTEIYTKIDSLI